MQNREELRQKGHAVLQDGEKYIFHKGGINIVFRPKYRPVGVKTGWGNQLWTVFAGPLPPAGGL
jgi:hypothetical protein